MPRPPLSASIDAAVEEAIRESVEDRQQPLGVAERICQILDEVVDGNGTLDSRSPWSTKSIRALLDAVEPAGELD